MFVKKGETRARPKMVCVLQITHGFPPTFGGVESHLWDVAHALTRRGCTVACLVGGEHKRDIYPVDNWGSIVVDRAPKISVQYLLKHRQGIEPEDINGALFEIHRDLLSGAIVEFQPDIIHLHNAHHFAPELAKAVFDVAGQRPVLNSVHDRAGEHVYNEVVRWPWQMVLYASKYLSVALSTNRPSVVLHLGIDLSLFRANGTADERLARLECPVIFHPARLLPWKGVLVGLEAFIEVRRLLNRGSLVLCDSTRTVDDPTGLAAYRAKIEARVTEANLEGQVHFLPFGREEMPAAYRASDLVWYPTTEDEPFGLAPLEAMACGVPVIVSRSGGMVETVMHDRTGLIVPKADPQALARSALSLLANTAAAKSLWLRLVSCAQTEVSRFSGDLYVDKLECIYRSLLN